jgi:hypothetical protein
MFSNQQLLLRRANTILNTSYFTDIEVVERLISILTLSRLKRRLLGNHNILRL